jgi:hypothetical protein
MNYELISYNRSIWVYFLRNVLYCRLLKTNSSRILQSVCCWSNYDFLLLFRRLTLVGNFIVLWILCLDMLIRDRFWKQNLLIFCNLLWAFTLSRFFLLFISFFYFFDLILLSLFNLLLFKLFCRPRLIGLLNFFNIFLPIFLILSIKWLLRRQLFDEILFFIYNLLILNLCYSLHLSFFG